MKQVERYIFGRIASSTAMIFVALGAMVWLSQALRQFDLVTANGQSLSTFAIVSALFIPAMLAVVLPVSMVIAVVYTFSSLNTDSELVVINASGASQISVLKPTLVVGVLAAMVVASMSLYFTPLSFRVWQKLITEVRTDILSTVMKEGQFMRLADGLTFHMKERGTDGTLRGIFLSDTRDPETSLTYLAERGALLENPLGTFLIMSNGTIQQRDIVDDSISIIEFSSYAFDLSAFTSGNDNNDRVLSASERPTSYLLNPDPDDRYRRQHPEKFDLEIHKRLSTPLYALALAVLPLMFLGQAESARQSRAAAMTAAMTTTTTLQVIGLFLPSLAERSMVGLVGMYAFPLMATSGAAIIVLTGVQLRPPESVVAFTESVFARFSSAGAPRSA